jgi:hypothetical protein
MTPVDVNDAQAVADHLQQLIDSVSGPSDPLGVRPQIKEEALELQSMLISLANPAAVAAHEGAVKEALRSIWHDLALLRAKREEKHLATLKKLVGDEEQWLWAIERAKTLMRHFGDIRAIDWLGDAADFSLSHGAVPLAAEQALSDIGTFEAERGAKR